MEILHGTVLSTLNLEKNLRMNPWRLETVVRQARPWGSERPGWILAPWLLIAGDPGESSTCRSLNSLICNMKMKSQGKAGLWVWNLFVKWGVYDNFYHHPDERRRWADLGGCSEAHVKTQNSICPKASPIWPNGHVLLRPQTALPAPSVKSLPTSVDACRHCRVPLVQACETKTK